MSALFYGDLSEEFEGGEGGCLRVRIALLLFGMPAEEAEQTLPVELGDHRQAGQAAEDELEQHAAAARIEIGKCRRGGLSD